MSKNKHLGSDFDLEEEARNGRTSVGDLVGRRIAEIGEIGDEDRKFLEALANLGDRAAVVLKQIEENRAERDIDRGLEESRHTALRERGAKELSQEDIAKLQSWLANITGAAY